MEQLNEDKGQDEYYEAIQKSVIGKLVHYPTKY